MAVEVRRLITRMKSFLARVNSDKKDNTGDDYAGEIKIVKENLIENQTKLDQISKELDAYKIQNSDFDRQIKGLEKKKADIEKQIQDEERLEAEGKGKTEIEGAISEAKTEIAKLETEISSLKNKLEENKSELKNKRKDAEAQIRRLNNELTGLKEDKKRLAVEKISDGETDYIDRVDRLNKKLESQLESRETIKRELEAEISESREKRAKEWEHDLSARILRTKRQLSRAEKQSGKGESSENLIGESSFKKDIYKLSKEVGTLEIELNETIRQEREISAGDDNDSQKIKKLEEEKDNLQNEIKTKEMEKVHQDSKLSGKESQKQNLKAQTTAVESEISTLKSRRDAERNRLNNEKIRIASEIERLKNSESNLESKSQSGSTGGHAGLAGEASSIDRMIMELGGDISIRRVLLEINTYLGLGGGYESKGTSQAQQKMPNQLAQENETFKNQLAKKVQNDLNDFGLSSLNSLHASRMWVKELNDLIIEFRKVEQKIK